MSKPTIEANIIEVETGIYYKVKLHGIPSTGELIFLHSFVEQVEGNQAVKTYEVVQIKHTIFDVTDKVTNGMDGNHFPTIYVKESMDKLFDK